MKKLVYIFIALLIFGCRHKEEEFEGPDLNDLFGPFYIISELNLSDNSLDFKNGDQLVFNAELSKRTPWVITITGLKSGAIATFEGKERIITSTNATWFGGADNFPAFNIEEALITLVFPNEEGSEIITDTVSIISEKIDAGTLITGFENGIGTNWGNTFSNAPSTIKCDGLGAKGNCYYAWEGTVGWDYGIGSVIIRPDAGTFNLQANASNLFFNMAVNFINNKDCSMILSFMEDENGDGIFDAASEDAYSYEYSYNKDGWDLISLNYGDLQFDAEGNSVEVNGNGLPEPSKLHGIDVIYIANPAEGSTKAFVDQLIFTVNEPYKP